MRNSLLLFAFLTFISFKSIGQVSFGKSEKLNDSWKFRLADVEGGQNTQLDDSRWQSVSLPHDWSVKGRLNPSLASATGYLPGGIGWYRKNINISKENEG